MYSKYLLWFPVVSRPIGVSEEQRQVRAGRFLRTIRAGESVLFNLGPHPGSQRRPGPRQRPDSQHRRIDQRAPKPAIRDVRSSTIVPRKTSRQSCRFGHCRGGQSTASAPATESRPKPQAAEVISSRGENLPKLRQSPREEMAERERSAAIGIGPDLNAIPKAGLRGQGLEHRPRRQAGAGVGCQRSADPDSQPRPAGESEANPWFLDAGALSTGNRPEIFRGIFAVEKPV